jgi:RNA polymerase sigma-70 factor (ECF subfamily)
VSPKPNNDESTLVAASCRGDVAAFTQLVVRHQGRIRALVGGLVHDRATADDLSQDVFLLAFRKLIDYRGDAPFGAWLSAVARNAALDHLRATVARGRHADGRLAAEFTQLLIDSTERDQRDDMSRERELTALRACLAELPPESAALVRGHYIDNRSSIEIARTGARGASGVRMTLMRIRSGLRQCIERRMAEWESV